MCGEVNIYGGGGGGTEGRWLLRVQEGDVGVAGPEGVGGGGLGSGWGD